MAGATFLSSPALLVPRGFPSSSFSSPARRHAYIQVCCQSKAEGFEDDESLQFRRRDFIGGCFTTAIALEYQRPWVEKYQRSRETVSRTNYEVDLITTLTKLSSLGQKINYEAYTYPKQKIDLGKLKL